jgi:hypothetical protein
MVTNPEHYSGSYAPEDVSFLLRRLNISPTNLPEREAAIQLRGKHYSEMIGPEDRPSRERLAVFRSCLEQNGARFASDLVKLADMLIASASGDKLALVSLARAGTPVGILLRRAILRRTGWSSSAVPHYSISVIRDRGVDCAALEHILEQCSPDSVRFIDGWTGKGTIAKELRTSLGGTGGSPDQLDARLWVPLDISGVAGWSASHQDYLIPSVILGGTISGLVSRSVLPRADIGCPVFHGCVALDHLRRYDISRWFLKHMMLMVDELQDSAASSDLLASRKPDSLLSDSEQALNDIAEEFEVSDLNRVKVGLGETVRVLLRRMPRCILLRDTQSADGRLVARLARMRGADVEVRPEMFYQAVAIIADLNTA